jgi:hypothetical protein
LGFRIDSLICQNRDNYPSYPRYNREQLIGLWTAPLIVDR